MVADLLIRGGEVLDGTGEPRRLADVAVKAGRVVAVAPHLNWAAKHEIDATGKVVAPGFIDCHTHDDTAVCDVFRMESKLRQGVTTVVVGNCGISAAPLTRLHIPAPLDILDRRGIAAHSFSAFSAQLEQQRPHVNVAFFVGLTTVRVEVMEDTSRPASADEIERMRALVETGLQAGALGVSVGTYYPPAQASTVDEVVAACAGMQGGRHVMSVHLRDEGDRVLEAMEEATQTAARLNVPLVISHHKLSGAKNHGRSKETLARLEEYARLQPVCMDCYPYAASSTMLNPSKVDSASKVQVAWSTPYPQYAGHDLDEVALQWQCTRQEAAERLMPGGAIYFSMDMADVRAILSHPLTMVASDGLPHDTCPHPRLWGSFPRVLGRMVREDGWFSLETAIHKMTGLPATRFGLQHRGVLNEGAWADVVVFDAQRIIDLASYASPRQAPCGIDYVVVNGEVKVAGNTVNANAHGQLLRNFKEWI